MLRKFITIFLTLSILLTTNSFAYTWVNDAGNYYVYDSNNNKVENSLVDTGEGVYYFDENGKMVIGWWENKSSGKVYFFNNNPTQALGSMLFGLRMIDGYYRYFGDDGSIQVADKEGEYKKVYLDFYADWLGNIYYNNVLMRDTTANKSEFYSDPIYYTDAKYNNAYFAEHGNPVLIGIMMNGSSGRKFTPGTQEILSQGNFENEEGHYVEINNATGGTNYTVDGEGKIIVNSSDNGISEFEQLGPMMNGAPEVTYE